jgi:hypothetical protein
VMPESRSTRLIGYLRRSETPRHSHFSPTPVEEILVPPFFGSHQPRKFLHTAFGKPLPCGRLILTHRSHIKHRCIKVSKLTHPRSKRRKKIFLFLKEEIELLCGAVEKLAPFVVYQSSCWMRQGSRMPIRCCKTLRSAASVLHCPKFVGRS